MNKPNLAYRFIKRTFDICASGLAMILLSWLFAIVAVLIKKDDGGPVIHVRKCVGYKKKPLDMYKFRTMVIDADNFEKYMSPEILELHLSGDKSFEDPRITKIGKKLRSTSLDELPQLMDVFLGKMSLIGPRPVVDREAEAYGDEADILLSIRPGITGYWQIYGRKDLPFLSEEAMSQQLYYAKNCSLRLDVKLFFQTIKALFIRTGK